MHIDILTIFPNMFTSPFSESIVKRAQDNHLVNIKVHDLRNWTTDKHKTVDDRPYGGGPGMIMMVKPIDKALKDIKHKSLPLDKGELEGVVSNQPTALPVKPYIILTSAKGNSFTQQKAQDLSQKNHLIFIAGHYEGVDQRVADHLVDESISIGNYVLTGGELPTMVIIDAIVRLIPGVVGESRSLAEESHNQPGYLEYPQYTRPESYQGWQVPKVLLSGNHAQIATWRRKKSSQE